MIEVCFQYMPAQRWTAVHPRACNMKASWSKAFEMLRYELSQIDATDLVVEAGYKPHQIKADGWPYQGTRPEHSHVRVNFKKDGTPISFSFGGWPELHMNVYMIAHTLEKLRAVDRYGCTKAGEQYRGWAQLPPSGHAMAEWASVEDAMRFLSKVGNGELHSVLASDLIPVYRAAAKVAHPDAGGSEALMAKVNRAKDFVEKHAA